MFRNIFLLMRAALLLISVAAETILAANSTTVAPTKSPPLTSSNLTTTSTISPKASNLTTTSTISPKASNPTTTSTISPKASNPTTTSTISPKASNPTTTSTISPKSTTKATTSGTTATATTTSTTPTSTNTTNTSQANSPIEFVVFIYQENQHLEIFDAAVNYTRDELNITINKIVKIRSDGEKNALKLCAELNNEIPDIVIDFTRQGNQSEHAKRMVRGLRLPTIAATFGQDGDIKEWRGLVTVLENYLIQVCPPADILVQSMRSIVDLQSMTSAVLLFDEQYEMSHKYKSLLQNKPCRHLLTKVVRDIPALRNQLDRLVHVDITNFFIAASVNEISQYLIEGSNPDVRDGPYFSDEFTWYSMSLEPGYPTCVGCRMNTSLVHLFPVIEHQSKKRENFLRKNPKINMNSLTELFYFDLAVDAIISIAKLRQGQRTPPTKFKCNEIDLNINNESKSVIENIALKAEFKAVAEKPGENIIGKFSFGDDGNGYHYPVFQMKLRRLLFGENDAVPYEDLEVGTWKSGFEDKSAIVLTVHGNGTQPLDTHVAIPVFRVVTVIQPPFVYRNETCMKENTGKYGPNKCYYGYCIDLFNMIVTDLKFNWTIRNVSEYGYMSDEEPYQWNGIIRELVDRRADIALGAISVMAERESVIDFTVPYYDLVGNSILLRKNKPPTSLFRFLTVLETDVWLAILGSYFFTSFIIWFYDRMSPMSYFNSKKLHLNDEEEPRDFNVKECLWFCMTSLTPQGGGEAPLNLSGRFVAAFWWLFGFIIIASYTANLAAFLTVQRLDTTVTSLDDLTTQFKVEYAPVKGSPAWIYFDRMTRIEDRFLKIWTNMMINDSIEEYERSRISIWHYPVQMKYTQMFAEMKANGPPETFEIGVQRVLNEDPDKQFALIAEATDVRYMSRTNCELQQIGEEFSRKPYAIAVQKGSPLKESISHMVLQLLNRRALEQLKEEWWTTNKATLDCPRDEDQSEGISIHNIGGVFIVIFVGIVLACFTLIFEYWWTKRKERNQLTEMRLTNTIEETYFVTKGKTDFNTKYSDRSRGRP